jgi:hypothetical protein
MREKIVIFKNAQETEIDANTQPEPKALSCLVPALRHFNTSKIVQQSGKKQQKKKSFAPGAIKVVARNKKQYVLRPLILFYQQPMADKYYRKEESEA